MYTAHSIQVIQLKQIQTGTNWLSIKDMNPRGGTRGIIRVFFTEFQAVGAYEQVNVGSDNFRLKRMYLIMNVMGA